MEHWVLLCTCAMPHDHTPPQVCAKLLSRVKPIRWNCRDCIRHISKRTASNIHQQRVFNQVTYQLIQAPPRGNCQSSTNSTSTAHFYDVKLHVVIPHRVVLCQWHHTCKWVLRTIHPEWIRQCRNWTWLQIVGKNKFNKDWKRGVSTRPLSSDLSWMPSVRTASKLSLGIK